MKNCPRDNTPLTFVNNLGNKFSYCKECSGIWLSIENMEASISLDVEKYMKVLLSKAIKMPTAEENKITCNCYHNTKLNKISVKNIYIDICPNCKGTWFDNGELAKIKNIIIEKEIEDKNNGLKVGKDIIIANVGVVMKLIGDLLLSQKRPQ